MSGLIVQAPSRPPADSAAAIDLQHRSPPLCSLSSASLPCSLRGACSAQSLCFECGAASADRPRVSLRGVEPRGDRHLWHATFSWGLRGPHPRDALEERAPQRRIQKRLGSRLEEVAKAVAGGYCRLQKTKPSKLVLPVRGTVSGHRLGALEGVGGGGGTPPPSNASLPHPQHGRASVPAWWLPLLPPSLCHCLCHRFWTAPRHFWAETVALQAPSFGGFTPKRRLTCVSPKEVARMRYKPLHALSHGGSVSLSLRWCLWITRGHSPSLNSLS